VGRRKARRPATDLVNGPHAVSKAGELKSRDATPTKHALQHADRLLAALEANAARATEPALITRLRTAIDRLVAS
jgi:hypothetical protein